MPAVVPRSARPDTRPEISPDVLLVPLSPVEAYAADVERLGGQTPLGPADHPADDVWLIAAHALTRAAELPRPERASVCQGGARTLRAVLLAHGSSVAADDRHHAVGTAAATALDTCADLLDASQHGAPRRGAAHGDMDDAERIRDAVAALQALVVQIELAGSFLLAFSTLTACRHALAPVLDARGRGLLLAQQGRVARQLGAFATARRLYHAAARAARTAGAPDVEAVALIGAGVLASMRGNYPEARTFYRRALRAATTAGVAVHQRACHHGLLHAAFAAHDLDTALAHGWAAIRSLPDDATAERAEALINLGEVGRQAGEHRAALGAALSALELTNLPRLRLPALGTAARAAAALGEHRLLDFLAADVERTVTRSGQQFENARAFVELAEAFDGSHDDLAMRYAVRARGLAAAGAFHEIAARADAVLGSPPMPTERARADAAPVRSARARAVLRTLEALPAARHYEALVAC